MSDGRYKEIAGLLRRLTALKRLTAEQAEDPDHIGRSDWALTFAGLSDAQAMEFGRYIGVEFEEILAWRKEYTRKVIEAQKAFLRALRRASNPA